MAATLIALLLLPFLTGRAASSAVRKLRAKLPFSTAEMSAEKDQLKAEFAIALRKVEIDLAKQSEKLAGQNIELRKLTEKLNGASKVGKASKLALEEIRAKEHDLNERLRQRDAQYAGLEQRSRQMLRENRELKLELKKEGKDIKAILAGRSAKPTTQKPSTSKSGLPIADVALAKEEGELSVQHLRVALSEARLENQVAERQIKTLKEKLATGKGNATDTKTQLPKAAIPVNLGGTEDATNEPAQASNNSGQYPDVQEQILDLAASLTAITALLEDDNPKVSKILSKTKADPEGALGARIKALLDAGGSQKPTATKKPSSALKGQTRTPSSATKPVEPPKPSEKIIQKQKTAATKSAEMPSVKGMELAKDVRPQTAANRISSTARKKAQPTASAKAKAKSSTSRDTPAKKTEKA
ncbi:MAG: hypothetical protein ABJK39_14900 [Hyphomicrobiales bacterium]